jgi:signal transduction histidine kinase/ABC-type multidrug transport system fused ATPase/permease subunit
VKVHRATPFERATGLFAVAWAVAALVLVIQGQITAPERVEPPIYTSSLGGLVVVSTADPEAAALGVERGQRVLAVDGVPVQQWYRERGWERIREGQPVRYRLEQAGGRIAEVDLPAKKAGGAYERLLVPVFAALVLAGVIYLAVGAFVWRMRSGLTESWAFLLFSASMATTLFSAIHTFDAWLGYERMAITQPLLGATMLHLFTRFPSEPPWIRARPRLRALPYAVAAACIALLPLERLGLAPARATMIVGLDYAFFAAVVSIGVLATERWRIRGSGATAAADLVLFGAVVSFVPMALLFAVLLYAPISVPISLALVWFGVFPLAVGYGIVRGRLFDVRHFARSSGAYGAATLAITGLFAALITFADAAFRRFNVNAESPLFSVVFLFLAILAFNPLRDRLQRIVDRVFDRDRAGHRDALREISEAMVSMLSLGEISERLLLAIHETIGASRSMVLLLEEEARVLRPSAWRGEWSGEARQLALDASHPVARQLWMRRQELSAADFASVADPETRERCEQLFRALDVQLLVPILFGVDLLGVIVVGEKLSGEKLGPEDRQLLRTLANQSAIAIENAQAFDEIAKLNETLETRVEERTRELERTQTQLLQSEKMRSLGQLVAGVAHELNNPIGFVHANLQLLPGYVQKLMEAQESGGDASKPRDAIRKLLSRSREGTERVKNIVMDLRSFSRMDQAELTDADLNAELGRTLGLMEPRFKDGIRIERELGQLPLVRCYPAQLNQVFMNLVMNACDALEGRGTVRIQTEPHAGGVRISISDDGPGIPPAIRPRLFEPFFTTKAAGQGTGLGLSISHGIVERHGGRLSFECPPEGGTVFRIDLPLVAKAPEAEAEAGAA